MRNWLAGLCLVVVVQGALVRALSGLFSPHPLIVSRSNSRIWKPSVGASWQIILSSVVFKPYPKVSVFDLDLFANSASTVADLHKSGIKAICYFSAGSYENWRPDAGNFTASDYGNPLVGWPGEYWLNTSSANVRNIMLARMDLGVEKGCDGLDPDNTDGYSVDNGVNLTEDTAVNYIKFLADAANQRGLSIGLKNSGEIIPRVIGLMQWAVNEQCVYYDECDVTRPFIDAGKPVFAIEYPASAPNITPAVENKICDDPQRANFSTLLKEMSLNEWYYACSLKASESTLAANEANRPGTSTSSLNFLAMAALFGLPLL